MPGLRYATTSSRILGIQNALEPSKNFDNEKSNSSTIYKDFVRKGFQLIFPFHATLPMPLISSLHLVLNKCSVHEN